MSSSEAELPNNAHEQPIEQIEEVEDAHRTLRSFGDALSSILNDERKGGPSLPPGTLRKRAAEKSKQKEAQEARETKKRLLEKDRVIPEAAGAAYERRLMKVATRGVVRLFNAVAAHKAAHDAEKEDDDEPDETRIQKAKTAERLTRTKFLEMLATPAATTTQSATSEV